MVNKKKTQNKKQKKPSSKLTTLFHPRSLRGGMALFALVFAFAGGVYYVYQGFAVSNPPLVIFSNSVVSTTSQAMIIERVQQDGTGLNTLASSTGGTNITAGKYSPNHSLIAWSQYVSGNPTGSIKVKDVSSTGSKNGLKNFALPANEIIANSRAKAVTWYPNSSAVLFPAWNTGTSNISTLKKLDLSNGQITSIVDISSNDGNTGPDITSYDVLGDGQTYVFANSTGLHMYRLGSLTRLSSNTDCTNIRRRPGTTNQFSYMCYLTNDQRLYRQVVGSTAITMLSRTNVRNTTANNTNIVAFNWSNGGNKVGLLLADSFSTSTAQCAEYDAQTRVATATVGSSAVTSITTTPKFHFSSSCKGGGSADTDAIVWSPDDSRLGFVANNFGTTTGMPRTVFSVLASSPFTKTQLLSKSQVQIADAPALSW